VIAAAKRVAANPQDAQAQAELVAAHKYLLDKLEQVKRDVLRAPQGANNNNQIGGAGIAGKEEQQLVAAAKEQASAALQLAALAEEQANKMTDPARKQKLKAAIQEVKQCSQAVVGMYIVVTIVVCHGANSLLRVLSIFLKNVRNLSPVIHKTFKHSKS
jgi:hypothetical protein